jgi:hypothetical protein
MWARIPASVWKFVNSLRDDAILPLDYERRPSHVIHPAYSDKIRRLDRYRGPNENFVLVSRSIKPRSLVRQRRPVDRERR